MRSLSLFIPLLLISFEGIYCQSFSDKITSVQKVFDKIVKAYGNTKEPPLLKLSGISKKESVPASYSSEPRPIIKIDEKFVDICFQLKDDSLNALAVVISHELAHHYYDHTFCTDYGYALGPNSHLGKQLVKLTFEAKIEKEANADEQGIWHATEAGYYPFGIFEKMINKIYAAYDLPDSIKNYPSKNDRKVINRKSQEKANRLFPIFEAGNILMQIGKYEDAATCFDEVKSMFPSRENYNNAGVAQLLAALQLKPRKKIEFIYPIELDVTSRLTGSRDMRGEEEQEKMNALLLSSKRNFEKAIQLEADYYIAYLNLACVQDILENPEGAVGKLKDLPATLQSTTIDLIKGIAYFHMDDTIKANMYFNALNFGIDSIIKYNLKLYQLREEPSTITELFIEEWQQRNTKRKTDIPENFKSYFEKSMQKNNTVSISTAEKKITVAANQNNTEIEITLNGKKFRAISLGFPDKTNEVKTDGGNYDFIYGNRQKTKWAVKEL